MNYQKFAHVYDQVMDQQLYEEWTDYAVRSFSHSAKRPVRKVMELACGTGEVSMRLDDKGYEVIGVDLSKNMLEIAEKKAQGRSIEWLQADMRVLDDVPTTDAVTLFSDSLCYLTDFEDVVSVFEAVYDHLEEGGIFLFDVHSLYQMQEVFPGYQYHFVEDDFAFLWQSYELDEPGSVEHVIDMYIKQEDGNLYEHFQEVHEEQTFPIEMYEAALEMVGFTNIKVIFERMLKLACASIIAVGMVAAILLPIIISLVSTKGGLQNSLKFEWTLQINPLEILSKLFLGSFDNDSWPAGPNLPNIYVASFGILGTIYYFISKKITKWGKVAAGFVLVVFLISCAHEFTSKLWHMGQNPAGFFYRFSWIIAFFLVYLAYLSLREVERFTAKEASILFVGMAIIFGIVQFQEHSFLTIWQRIATLGIFMIMLLVLFWTKAKKPWAVIAVLTAVELTANAAIVQSRVGYTDAYKYHDAVLQLKDAINPIRPDDTDFYRINKTFNLSKNDPFMVDYPGLSVFSSNLENSTRDLFDRLGNNGINATTYYQGTPLQDALFSVKYLVAPKPVYTKEYPDTSKMYVFGNMVTRKDITSKEPVYEATRTKTYETGLILPIAYGVNDATVNVKLENHQPIQNHNKIVQAMGATSENYLTLLAANEVKLDNMEVPDSSKPETYKRVDSSKPGTITYHLVPQSSEDYWVSIPQKLSHTNKNKVRILLNGNTYDFQDKFQQTQLIQVAHDSLGKAVDLTIEIDTDDEYNLSGLRLARSNSALVNRMIEERQLQGMKVTHWDDSHIQGTVNITDDSTWMMTSIPYEKGWTVKVDGQVVGTAKVWDSLLAFQITPGEHTIEMTYMPEGFMAGFVISILSICIYVLAIYKKWI